MAATETPEQLAERQALGRWVVLTGAPKHQEPFVREHLVRPGDTPRALRCGPTLRNRGFVEADGSRLPCQLCLKSAHSSATTAAPVRPWAMSERELERRLRRVEAERDELVKAVEERALTIQGLEEYLALARRDRSSWEDWGKGWKDKAEANQVEREKAWAELEIAKAKLRVLRESVGEHGVPLARVDTILQEVEARYAADKER